MNKISFKKQAHTLPLKDTLLEEYTEGCDYLKWNGWLIGQTYISTVSTIYPQKIGFFQSAHIEETRTQIADYFIYLTYILYINYQDIIFNLF